MFRMFRMISQMWTDFNFWAIFTDPEKHPEAKTLKDFHEKLVRIVEKIRDEVPNADEDPSFKQVAEVVAKLLPIGTKLESVPLFESAKLEAQRVHLMREIGKDRLVNVTGEASKQFAQRYAKLMQAFLEKKYWPDKDCRTGILNQSYLATYDKDFKSWLPDYFREAIKELNARITRYEETLQSENSSVEEKKLAM